MGSLTISTAMKRLILLLATLALPCGNSFAAHGTAFLNAHFDPHSGLPVVENSPRGGVGPKE